MPGRPGDHYNTMAMARVAILGAGELGGALAHKLAARDQVGSVCLIDAARGTAAGKALDIRQAGPVERFETKVTAAAVDAVVGAAVVVLADPAAAPKGDGRPDPGPALLERIRGLTGDTPVVCAGANAGPLVAWSVRELGMRRTRIFGSAPGALVAGLRALIALEADISPAEVVLQVLGTPPAYPVVAWSCASIGGCPLEDRLPPPALARVRRARRPSCGRPVPMPWPRPRRGSWRRLRRAARAGRSRASLPASPAGRHRRPLSR